MIRHLMVLGLVLAIGAAAAWAFLSDPATGEGPGATTLTAAAEEETLAAEADAMETTGPAESAPGTRREEAGDSRIRVRGRIVDAGDEPVADQEVRLGTGDVRSPFRFYGRVDPEKLPAGWLSARTAPDGRFEFTIPLGESGRVSLGGKERILAKRCTFAASQKDIDLGDLECLLTASVAGHVHESGKGIAEVRVTVYSHGQGYFSRRTKTDAEGRFELAGLRPGSCQLMCSSGRHLSRQSKLELSPGEKKTNVSVELEPGSSLAGQVLDDIGRPISGVKVSAYGHHVKTKDGQQYVEGKATSDKGGYFTLNGLAGKKVNIQASSKGYQHYYKNSVPVDGAMLVIELVRLGSVSGVLVSESGEPIAGSRVVALRDRASGESSNEVWAYFHGNEAMLQHGPSGPGAKTDDQGRFEIANVKPGSIKLVATGEHAKTTLGGLSVHAGATTEGVRMQASRGVVVHVTVHDPDGKPVAGANVFPKKKRKSRGNSNARMDVALLDETYHAMHLHVQRPGTSRHRTDEKGQVAVYGLEAGEYVISASEKRWVRGSKPVTLPQAGELAVQVDLRRGGFVEVLTVDTNGQPAGDLSFRVKPKQKGGRQRSGRTDATGRARVGPLAPGAYTAVLARKGGGGWAVAPVVGGDFAVANGGSGLDGTQVAFEIRAGATEQVKLTQPILCTVTGSLRDTGGPVAEGVVSVRRVGATSRSYTPGHSTRSKANGSFELTDLEAGRWEVSYRRTQRSTPFRQQFTLAPGTRSHALDLMITGHTLRIRVRGGGAPLAGASVRLRATAAEGRGFYGNESKKTGANGEVEFAELPPNGYRIDVDHGSFAGTIREIDLRGADSLTIELVPGGALAVQVTGAGASGGTPSAHFVLYRKKGTSSWKSKRAKNGACKIERLEPGEYELRVTKPFQPGTKRGAQPALQTAVVRAGVTEQVVLRAD